MQVIINKDFSIATVEPSAVYQNSSNAAYISVFAPFKVTSYAAIEVNFTLPNGEKLSPLPALGVSPRSLDQSFGVWSIPIDARVTEIAGMVSFSLVFVGATENGVTVRQPTGTATFEVLASDTPAPPNSDFVNKFIEAYEANLSKLLNDFQALAVNSEALVDLKTLVGESLPEGVTEKTVIDYIESVAGDLEKKSAIKVNGEVQTEWDADNVLKFAPSTGRRVVAVDPNGSTVGVTIDNATGARAIAQRTPSGEVCGVTSDTSGDTVLVNKQYLSKKLTELANTLIGEEGAIEALDTLRELGAAINNDADFAGTMIKKHDEMEARLDKVDKFTADDVNKFVVVAEDGTLAAIEIATGGSY